MSETSLVEPPRGGGVVGSVANPPFGGSALSSLARKRKSRNRISECKGVER